MKNEFGFGVEKQAIPLEELVGKPIKIKTGSNGHSFGIYRGQDGEYHVLKPQIIHKPDGTKEESELPYGVRADALIEYEGLTKDVYDSLLEPHPWKALEGEHVLIQAKSGSHYIGLIKLLDWHKTVLNPFLPLIGTDEAHTDLTIDNGDILVPVPIGEKAYHDRLAQIQSQAKQPQQLNTQETKKE